jgi:cell fate regulator YaaT (PSP1 superfamily)
MNSKIIGIRFQKVGKIYHFDAKQSPEIVVGDFVVVETSRGKQLGEVTQIVDDSEESYNGPVKPITRKANPRDLVLRQVWNRREGEAVESCRQKISELEIEGVKVISAEYTLDGKRLTFLYTSEGDERVDLGDLNKAMKRLFQRTRIELRQIGPRDAAKIIGGMGACGLPNRCCSKFLLGFSPISIRMAKAQDISLAPTEITGMCGRLRCCLMYEYDHYVEARKELPRVKKRIPTPLGEGKVVKVSPLIKRILVDLGDAGMKEFDIEELRSMEGESEGQVDQKRVKSKNQPKNRSTRDGRNRRKKR